MTTQEKIKAKIQKLEDNRNTTFGDVTCMLKKFDDLYKSKQHSHLFWSSTLTTKFLSEFKSNNWLLQLLLGYFSNPTNQNPAFTEQVAKNYPADLVKSIKLSQVFYDNNWFNHLSNALKTHSNSELSNFFKEITFLKTLNKDWKDNADEYTILLSWIPYEKLLARFSDIFYSQKNMFSTPVMANMNYAIEYTTNLCYVLNDLLNCKKRNSLNNKIPTNATSWQEMGTEEDEKIRNVIWFFVRYHNFKNIVDKYCVGYADFKEIRNNRMIIKTNESYVKYKENELKLIFIERLILEKQVKKNYGDLASKEEMDKKTIASAIAIPSLVESSLRYFQYLKLPEKYMWEGKEIEIKKVFQLLYSTAEEPTFFTQKSGWIVFNQKEDEIIKNLSLKLGFKEDETKLIINFLTTGLEDSGDENIDVLCKPFIKIGNEYFLIIDTSVRKSLGAAMHTRLNNEIKKSKEIQNALTEAAKGIECEILSVFKNNGHTIIEGNKDFELKNGKKGEFDIFAFKDGVLFLIEIKTSSPKNLITRVKDYFQCIEFKASQQLDDAKQYVGESKFTTEFKEKFGFGGDEIKEIKILIASNTFEQHHTQINEKYLKISIFELLVILSNEYENLNELKMKFYLDEIRINEKDQNLKKNSSMLPIAPFSLWSGDKCSAKDLTEAIEENKIWDFLAEIYDFKNKDVELPNWWDLPNLWKI